MKWRVQLVRTGINCFRDFVKWNNLCHNKNTKIDENTRTLVVYHAKIGGVLINMHY